MATGLPLWQHKHFFKGLIFLFAFLLFANSIPNDYNMDDELVTINHRLTSKGVSAIPEIFTSPYYQDAQGYSYEYRPVVLVSFAIEHQFFGDNAHVSHFFNIVLYALCCLVLYLVLLRLFKKHFHIIPLAITLLFIAHPAHTEVVCSIKNRDEILGLLFSFLTLHSALIAIQNSKKWLLILVPLFFTLALMSKITVISFVILIPLALILFTEAGLGSIMLTTILLQIPSYFLLNLSSGFEKIMAQLGITVIVLVFYMLVNPQKSIAGSKKFFNRIYVSLFQLKLGERQQDSTGNKEYWFRDVFKGIMPDRKMFSILPFLIAGLLASAYLLGITKGYSSLGLLPLVVLIILAWKGEEKISWWATVMIGFVLVMTFWYCATFSNHLLANSVANTYSKFVVVYLAYQLTYGRKNIFLPTLIFYALFNFIRINLLDQSDEVLSVLLIYLLSISYVRYVVLLAMVILIANIYPFHNTTDAVDVTQSLLGIIVVLLVHFKKGGAILPWLLLAAAVFSFHFYQVSWDKPTSIKETTATLTNVANQINPKIIATPQYRPLGYIEECVTTSDPVSVRVGTSLEICFHYLQKVILPYPLSFYYGYKFISPQKATETIPVISLVLHLVLLLLAFVLLRKQREISYGLFVYLISIVVFSNYLQYVPGMLADRFLLIPSLGWCIAFVFLLQKVFKFQSNATTVAAIPAKAKSAFAGVLILYSSITFSRNFDWKDRLTLFRHDINYVQNSAQAHNLLAIHLMKHSFEITNTAEQKQIRTEALGHYKVAMEISPFYNAAFDIGRTYVMLENIDSAIIYFKKAIAINPANSDAHLFVAKLLMETKRNQEAIPYFEYRVKNFPSDYSPYETLSYIYFSNKEYTKSITTNMKAVKQFPAMPEPLINIARTYAGINKNDSARIFLQEALKVSPNNATASALLLQLK